MGAFIMITAFAFVGFLVFRKRGTVDERVVPGPLHDESFPFDDVPNDAFVKGTPANAEFFGAEINHINQDWNH